MEPSPGSANASGRRSPVRGSCTLTSDTACRRQDASSRVGVVSAPPPSMNATSSRTAVGSSASRVVQCSTPGAVGSVTAIRPRGASRLVCTYSRPSRATHAPVCGVEAHGDVDERRRPRVPTPSGPRSTRRCAARSPRTRRRSASARRGRPTRRSSSCGRGPRRTPRRRRSRGCPGGAARCGGGTAPRPAAAPPGAAGGRSRTPRRPAARPRGSTAPGRSARRPARRWPRPGRAARSPRCRRTTPGTPPGGPPWTAATRRASSCRRGRSRWGPAGRARRRRRPPRRPRAPGHRPGARRTVGRRATRAGSRSRRPAGHPAGRSGRRWRTGRRCASDSRYCAYRSSCAADHASVRSDSASSSPRNGSATRCPCRSSTRSVRGAGGYGRRAGAVMVRKATTGGCGSARVTRSGASVLRVRVRLWQDRRVADDPGTASDALLRLAGAYGVVPDHWDFHGQSRRASAATLQGVLGALGVDASSPERVDLAIAHVEDMPWRRVLPPVLVVRQGRQAHVPGARHARGPRRGVDRAGPRGRWRSARGRAGRRARRATDGRRPAGRARHVHAADGPAARLARGRRRGAERQRAQPAGGDPVAAGAARGAAGAAGRGGSWPSCTRCARGRRGASATWRTSPRSAGSPGGSSTPTSCSSTRCTPPSRPPR